jgi:predicted amidohydrolase
MFLTGFSMNTQALAVQSGQTGLEFLKAVAAEKNSAVAGSLMAEDHGRYFNRFFFARPDGSIQYYDKRHLFRPGKEAEYYSAGNKRVLVDYEGWKINLQICYDLRFPVWNRNDSDFDMLIYVANWPDARQYAFEQLSVARAIENQCYVVRCNRTGTDGSGLSYAGGSAIIDHEGKILCVAGSENRTLQHRTDRETMINFRRSYPFLADRDPFTIDL